MLDFPSSPSDGQTYSPVGGPTYTWDDDAGVWRTSVNLEALMRISTFIPGIPTNQDGYVFYIRLDLGDQTLIFADDFPLCTADALAASSASAVFNLKKNGVTVATIEFDTDDEGVWSSTGSVSFEDGDFMGIEAPSSPDSTLSGVTFTIVGSRS